MEPFTLDKGSVGDLQTHTKTHTHTHTQTHTRSRHTFKHVGLSGGERVNKNRILTVPYTILEF